MVDFEQLKISETLKSTLSNFKINFVFQPILNRNNKVIGHEALMRPEGHTISDFINKMKEENQLHAMELATFFGASSEYQKRNLSGYLHINSFPSECFNEEEVSQFYQNFSTLENCLVIEILEYLLTDSSVWKKKKCYTNRYKGISFALDDFGTGFNGIKAIQYYDPNVVKIDRSMISNIDSNIEKQDVYKSMVALLHEEKKLVLAEGVETEAEYKWLYNANTDLFQGFYLGRPS